MSKPVVIYSAEGCSYCMRAKQLLDMKRVSYTEIRVDLDSKQREKMEKISHRKTVPQIFIGDRHVGGFDDLKKLQEDGMLDDWLKDSFRNEDNV